MGKTSRIRLAAFDGEYEFQLRLAGVVAIEEKAGCGIGAVYGQIMRGRFRFDDGKEFGAPPEAAFSLPVLLEVVRQGLIGGGKGISDGVEISVSALKANLLIDRYLNPDNGGVLMEAWNLAAAVIDALVEGVDELSEASAPAPAPASD